MFYITDSNNQKRVMFASDLDSQSKKLIMTKAKEMEFTVHLTNLFDSKLVDIVEALDYLGLQLNQKHDNEEGFITLKNRTFCDL